MNTRPIVHFPERISREKLVAYYIVVSPPLQKKKQQSSRIAFQKYILQQRVRAFRLYASATLLLILTEEMQYSSVVGEVQFEISECLPIL